MKKETIWMIILIASLFLLIHGMTGTASPDKKTAQAAQGEAALGGGGLVAFAFKKQIWPWFAFLAIAASVPFIFGQYKNLFFPPTIPGWAWGAGIFLIIIMMMGSRR